MVNRELTQCTPMIHFQAGEVGATLRATEVKPKLDRFIYRWCKKNGKKVETEWLVEAKQKDAENRHRALDYKLRFVAQGAAQIAEPMKGLYFGNMGDGERRETVFYKAPVGMKILCLHPELENVLEECVDLFFLTTNFGTRQDKGFGGFVTDKWREAEGKLAWWFGENRVYKMEYPTGTDPEKILNDVRMIYQVFKCGYNIKPDYIKSFLTTCFLEKQIGGEKRYIKEKKVGPVTGKPPEGKVKEYLYIRGLFGVGDQQRWKEEDGKGWRTILFQCEGKELDRVPSPILFKIAGSALYMMLADLPKKVYGARYCFGERRSKPSASIPIPTVEKLKELGLEPETILRRYASALNGEESSGENIRELMAKLPDRPRKDMKYADRPFFVQKPQMKFAPVG